MKPPTFSSPLSTEPLQLTLASLMNPTCKGLKYRKPWHFCTAVNEESCWFQYNCGQQKLCGYFQGEEKPKPESIEKLAPFWRDRTFHFTRCVKRCISCSPSYLIVPDLELHSCSCEHAKGLKKLPIPTDKHQRGETSKTTKSIYKAFTVYFMGLFRIFHIGFVI